MIHVENLSYGVPTKDLFQEISFTIESGEHAALIGSNGTGKSMLADILVHPDQFLFEGTVEKDENCRIGYASQFHLRPSDQEQTVFEFLSQQFLDLQAQIAKCCDDMATGENLEELFEHYQALLDRNEAMDGDNYENVIRKNLGLSGMEHLAEHKLYQVSGGEFKLLQIMKEMLLSPTLLILDEPDVFLDFENLASLVKMINSHKGSLLVVTHNRYLLNHCFNKILHLEGGTLQQFAGGYADYRKMQLLEKLSLKVQYREEQNEIRRTQEMVETLRKRATLMVNPTIGRSVNAKQTQLDRLLESRIESPFIEIREPEIRLPEIALTKADDEAEKEPILSVSNYALSYEQELLQDVNFEIMEGETVALIGANGTGKTSMLHEILAGTNPAIHHREDVTYAAFSQLLADDQQREQTVTQFLTELGYGTEPERNLLLHRYGLHLESKNQKLKELSVGEQNLLQLATLETSSAEFLLLDEPTSHLDLPAQAAVEHAIENYKGTILMVSHDFYLIASCADRILFVEDGTIRPMRARKFRKMVYDRYFGSEYLIADRERQALENDIQQAFKKNDLETAEALCEKL